MRDPHKPGRQRGREWLFALSSDGFRRGFGGADERVNNHLVLFVVLRFAEFDSHTLTVGTGNVLEDVIRFYRDLAMSAVNQHGEPHRTGAARFEDNAELALDGSSGINDVVDQNNLAIFEAQWRQIGFSSADPPDLFAGAVKLDVSHLDFSFRAQFQFC